MTQTLAPKTLALLTLALSAWMAPAHALDIAPYSAQILAQKQQAGEAVSLHFPRQVVPHLLGSRAGIQHIQGRRDRAGHLAGGGPRQGA